MSFSRLRIPFAHERHLAPPSCPKCGERALIAESTEYSTAGLVRHVWVCDPCGNEFETAVRVSIAS